VETVAAAGNPSPARPLGRPSAPQITMLKMTEADLFKRVGRGRLCFMLLTLEFEKILLSEWVDDHVVRKL
jgi:hypothetical protein